MTEPLLNKLREVVGPHWVQTDPKFLEPLLNDHRGYYQGKTFAAVCPADTAQTAKVLALAHQSEVAVVPSGGNTGLCGGATPDESGGQMIVSLKRLNRIRVIDAIDHTMTVEAGVILQNAKVAAEEEGLFFPLDLAAKGSCQIGGNLATNAGGINVLRYGNARDLVLGLEVVLADGSVWDGLSCLRKDNTGYDLKHLFMGSEGTLGIITAAVLKLFPRHLKSRTAMLAVRDPDAACRLLGVARSLSGDALVSYEYLFREAVDCVLDQTEITDPFPDRHAHYVLLELMAGFSESFLDEVIEELMQQGMASEWIVDGVLAQNERQRQTLWNLRESVSTSQRGSVKNDIAVPISRLPEFLSEAQNVVQSIAPGARPCPFGHFGDGNLHYNILGPRGFDGERFRADFGAPLVAAVTELAMSMNGSFSAEHGVGKLRKGELYRYKSPVAVDLMKRLKRSLDPKGILNPGKVL